MIVKLVVRVEVDLGDYGDDPEEACERVKESVSELIYDLADTHLISIRAQ